MNDDPHLLDTYFYLPGIHDEVNNRVDGGVGHGQPVEGEEDVLCVLVPRDVLHNRLVD